MNFQEVEKHLKFQYIVRVIIYILVGLCFFLSLFAILITPTKAAGQLKSTNITQAVMNTSDCGSASNNSYCWCSTGVSSQQCYKLAFGSTGGYTADTFIFDLHVNSWAGNAPSTIELYSPTNMWANVNYSCYFSGANAPSTCSVARVSSNRININFTTGSNTPPYYLYVYTENPSYFSNLSINKVMLLQTVEDPNTALIQNQQQNTTDIINNANQNTETITNSLTSMMNSQNLIANDNIQTSRTQLESMCSNSYSVSLTKGGLISGNSVTSNNLGFYSDYINVNLRGNTISRVCLANTYQGNTPNQYLIFYDSNKNVLQTNYANNACRNLPSGTAYFRIGTLYPGALLTAGDYCQKAEDQINSYLRDDTNPSVNENDINNTLGLVSTSNPLSYLLTLPLNLLNKINVALNSSCSDYEIGHFNDIGNANLSAYTFKLKCINPANYLGSTLWGVIDTIMAIGLLVITIKWFYNSISNFLTLGGEDEAKRHLGFMSPMEWFSTILGTGSVSSGWDGGKL